MTQIDLFESYDRENLLLDLLIAYNDAGKNKGLPIGNLTSQLFANMYLDEFDHFMKRDLKLRY